MDVAPNLSDKEKKKIYFPIIKDKDKWSDDKTVILLVRYCDPKFLRLLELVQPFNPNIGFGGKEPAFSPLELLHQLDINDKHHLPRFVEPEGAALGMNMSVKFFSEDETDIPSAEIFMENFLSGGTIKKIKSDFPMEKINGKFDFAARLEIDGHNLLQLLADFSLVTQTIIANFEGMNELDKWPEEHAAPII